MRLDSSTQRDLEEQLSEHEAAATVTFDRMTAEIAEAEEQLADAVLEVDRLERMLADEQTTNRELRERIAALEKRPTIASGTTWSRERDHTSEA